MDNKLTLQQFANMLATDAECAPESVAAILKSLSGVIAADLLSRSTCRVKDFGEFKVVTTDEGYKTVAFQAQPTLADTINAPFSSFPTVDLDDDYTDPEEAEELITSEAEHATESAPATAEPTTPPHGIPAEEPTEEEPVAEQPIATTAEDDEIEEATPVSVPIPPIPVQAPPVPSLEEPPPFDPDKAYAPPSAGYVITSEEEEYINSLDSSGRSSALTWVLAILAILLGIGALAFFAMNILL